MPVPEQPSRASILVLASLALAGAACRPAAPVPSTEVVVALVGALPSDPSSGAWSGAAVHVATMIPQDMVEPRLLAPSTTAVRVQALSDGSRIAFRLEWVDPTRDETQGPALFSDACAVQLPSEIRADVPAPQMGELGRAVEITAWRAAWQAQIEGRGNTLRDLYPNAAVDAYPFEAASLEKGSEAQREMELRYAPARALGNAVAGPHERPVQDLVAQGPGTLSPGASFDSDGRGMRTASGWAVVITRRCPSGLDPGHRTQVAFAVWDGSRQEGGARKMRTGWVPMHLEARP